MTTKKLSFCILGCYPKTSRENFKRSDVGQPHELFHALIARQHPQAHVDTLFIADEETPIPQGDTLNAYDGWIWTGSDLTVYHKEDPRVTRQILLAKDLYHANAHSFGSCWGLQIAALAAGGAVDKNPKGREWGIARNIELTPEGIRSPLTQGKPTRFNAFIMHLDEVTSLPKNTPRLAGNTHTEIQAALVTINKGSFWATQYHCEYNLHEMARLIRARAQALVKEGFFSQEDHVRAYAEELAALHKNPGSQELRRKLDIGDDIIDPAIREIEIRNWLDFLSAKK